MPQRTWALLLIAFVVAGVTLGAAEKNVHNEKLVRTFEKRLLTMFGLNTRPKPKRNVTVSDYMWELYKRQTKFHTGLYSKTNTIRCFRGQDKNSRYSKDAQRARYDFKVTGIPDNERVWAAELVVYRRGTPGSESRAPVHRVQVFDVLRPGSKNSEPILRLVDTRVFNARTSRGHWESFDVLPALQRWLQEPSSNHGLMVQLSSSVNATSPQHVRLKREVGESRERWLEFQPLLVTYSKDVTTTSDSRTSTTRNRRSTRKHRRKGRKDNCRRHTLYVDFSDVGWNDWIVAPPGYDAYFCHGDCPFPLADHLNSTNHAIVQTLVNSVNPAAVPRACCVPTELSPISMLYVDEYDKVVLKNYQDMVVEGCGCR